MLVRDLINKLEKFDDDMRVNFYAHVEGSTEDMFASDDPQIYQTHPRCAVIFSIELETEGMAIDRSKV